MMLGLQRHLELEIITPFKKSLQFNSTTGMLFVNFNFKSPHSLTVKRNIALFKMLNVILVDKHLNKVTVALMHVLMYVQVPIPKHT